MYKKISILFIVCIGMYFWFYASPSIYPAPSLQSQSIISGSFDSSKSKPSDEWRKILTKEQYRILREGGTETPHTGELNQEKRAGTYYSYGCDMPLFRSEQKYDSGTGWPSFTAPINQDSLVLRRELDGRIEVLDPCAGHLGHVFEDGPEPTGKRYCINSISLYFKPDIEASFGIITNGLTRNFSAPMYHNLDSSVYIEPVNPNIVHIKRPGVTWDDFFATLPFRLTADCLTTGTGQTYCSDATNVLTFTLNSVDTPNALSQVIESGDKLIVAFQSRN